MSGNFDHLSNRELADMLAGYNLYGTTRTSGIPGPVLLRLAQARLRATEPLPETPGYYHDGKDELVLGLMGERILVKGEKFVTLKTEKLIVPLSGKDTPPETIEGMANRVRLALDGIGYRSAFDEEICEALYLLEVFEKIPTHTLELHFNHNVDVKSPVEILNSNHKQAYMWHITYQLNK